MRALWVAIAFVAAASVCLAQPQAKPWETWQPPEVTLPNPNAFDVYLKAFELKRQLDAQFPRDEGAAAPGAPVQNDPWGEGPTTMPVPDRVLLYGEVLKTAREALPLACAIEPPAGVETLLPHFREFRATARLFAMEAEVRRLNDDYAGAATSALDAFEMAQDAKSQDILISYLVGAACEALALASLDQTLPHLTADEAKAALARLQTLVAGRRPLARALDGELTFWRNCFKQVAADPVSLRRSIREIVEKPLTDAEADKMVAELPRTWHAMTDYHALLQRNVALPYAQRDKDLSPPADDPLLAAMVPSFARVLLRDVASTASCNLHLLALAVQACRAEHGAFPAQLADLVPGTLAALPQDPFTGGPLAAVAKGDRLVLYSFGPDGVDDHGTDAGKGLSEKTRGDIILELGPGPAP